MTINNSQPIFIIGISRSGSKFYQQLLNSNNEICIAPEMNFYFPFKQDVRDLILKNIHKGSDKIVEELYKSPLKNTFKDIISTFDRIELTEQIKKNGQCNVGNIFKSILQLHCEANGKKIYGAKFPIHNSKLHFLNKHFPTAKIIFIIRNPFDIFYSDLIKKIHRANNEKSSFVTNNTFIIKLIFPFYIAFEWSHMLRNYEKYISKFGSQHSILLKYEMIESKPNIIVDKIAKLLEISPSKFDLNKIQIVDSSKKNIISHKISRPYISISKFLLKTMLFCRLKKYNIKY